MFHIVFQETALLAVVKTCIETLTRLRFSSIAFPGIGTGNEGFPPDDSAREMLNGLQQCQPPYALNVRIVLFKDPVYQAFKAALSDKRSHW